MTVKSIKEIHDRLLASRDGSACSTGESECIGNYEDEDEDEYECTKQELSLAQRTAPIVKDSLRRWSVNSFFRSRSIRRIILR
jgi:hypothetical protein